MGQIIVIDTEHKHQEKFIKILPKKNITYISNQDNLEMLGEEIEAIIIDSPKNTISYLKEIRQKNIILPIIIIIYPEENIKDISVALRKYQAKCISYSEIDNVDKILTDIFEKNKLNKKYLNPYLLGNSPKILQVKKTLWAIARLNTDVFLFSETGCGKRNIAYWLYTQMPGNQEFMELNLNNYMSEDYEVHVWAALKEIYNEHPTELDNYHEPLYKTLYVKGLENKDILFIVSLLEWMYQKRKNSLNPIRVVVALEDKKMLQALSRDFLEKYLFLELPALNERKEDLVEIVQYYLTFFNEKYSRNVSYLGADFLDFIKWYSWPGNIGELRYNLEAIFLANEESKKEIALRDLFINEEQIFAYCLQNTAAKNYNEALKILKKIGI